MNNTISNIHRLNSICWQEDQHCIQIGEQKLYFTKTEYNILSALRYGTAITYKQLTLHVYQRIFDDTTRVTIEKHIATIRTKLQGTGFYVYCVSGYGYLLLPEYSLLPQI